MGSNAIHRGRTPVKTSAPRTIVAATLALAAGAAFAADATVRPRVVALTGTAAPGLGTTLFGGVSGPCLAPAGGGVAVAFTATLSGTGVTAADDGSIWTDRSGALVLAYREGNAAPGIDGGVFEGLPIVGMNEDALLAFGAAVVTTTPWIPTNIALFAETTPGVLALAVRETPGTFFTPGIPAIVGVYSLSTLLPFGDDAVAAWTIGAPTGSNPPNLSASLTRSDGVAYALATPVPDAPAASQFQRYGEPVPHGPGGFAFRGAHSIPTGTPPSGAKQPRRFGIYSDFTGPLVSLALTEAQVLGAPAGQTWRDLSKEPAPLPDGSVVFWARVAQLGIPADLDSRLVRAAADGAITFLAASGDPAPGILGATLASFDHRLGVDDAGNVAFLAFLGGAPVGQNAAIYMGATGTPGVAPILVARRGGRALGLPAAATLHTLGTPRLGDPGLVTPGLIAFTATIAGPGVTPASSSVLLAGRADLVAPRVVLRTGDAFATPAGTKTIRQISFDHDRAGRAQLAGNALAATSSSPTGPRRSSR